MSSPVRELFIPNGGSVWSAEPCAITTAPLTLGLRQPFLDYVAAGILLAVLSMIPLTIGGLGMREWASILIFPLLGISESTAILLAWMGALGFSLAPALVGLAAYLLLKGRFSLKPGAGRPA